MTLHASTGVISGTPTGFGGSYVTVQVTDAFTAKPQSVTNNLLTIFRPANSARNDTVITATPIGPGIYNASLSPYWDTRTDTESDHDYYQLTAIAGAMVKVGARALYTQTSGVLDTVIEIVDANGIRLQKCWSQSSYNYTGECLNDDQYSGTTDSLLQLQVPGTAGQDVVFFLHVLDWRGDARPDMLYELNISGTK
ncbi:MAG TPA: hypothetical protein VN622_02110 [Clostridia bacterium]|nr:hypothetical protein [Clostridia bacterium]